VVDVEAPIITLAIIRRASRGDPKSAPLIYRRVAR
jgi:hypothetical protein